MKAPFALLPAAASRWDWRRTTADREVIATRIIDLARNGVSDAKALSDRIIAETKAMLTP